MTNANKARGDRFERRVLEYVRANGFPGAERTRPGRMEDQGDVFLAPGLIVQAKDWGSTNWRDWFAQLCKQIIRADADHGVLVIRRRGIPDPGQALAVMPLAAWVELARKAGYGTEVGE